MLDLIITTICMILIFFFPFFLFKSMKIFNLLLLFINYILIMVLIFNNKDYRELDIWKFPEEFHPIQKTIFLPIKSIKGIYDSNSNLINLDFMKTDGIFSIVKSEEYSKECLHNYFIKPTSECPMTDIILEKTQVNTHYKYFEQKISDDMYLYYTKENKLDGKLYKDISINLVGSGSTCNGNNNFKINNKCSTVLFKSNFDYKNVSAIIDLEEEKKSNPFKNFKNYVNYWDKICVLLIILSFMCTIYEPFGHKAFNYYKIISWNCHSYILILLSIRYHKYRKIKQYLNENKDIYNDNLPHAVFNLDTVILSISISFFVYYILYLIIPLKCHCFQSGNQNNDNDENEKYIECLKERKRRIFALSIPLYIIFYYIMLYEILNDLLIKENYKIINYNWELNSITSISISYYPELGHSYIENGWKNVLIEYRTNEYNYYNISTNNNDNLKICGKDSQDNDLYFPKDVECPVNDIFISKFDSNEYDGYTKLKISDETGYLYYTNKKTTGKIVTAIIVGTNDPLKIYSGNNYLEDDHDENNYNDYFENNEKKAIKNNKIDRFNTQFFYEEIDSWNKCENEGSCSEKDVSKLYAINYLGVNKNLFGKINDFKKYLDKFYNLCTLKYVSYGLNFFFFICFSAFLLSKDVALCSLGIGIIFLLSMIFFIIINTICLRVNIEYIQHFLNKINIDFERYKCDSIWIFLLNIIGIIFFFYYLSIIVYSFLTRKENNTNSIGNNNAPNQNPSENDTEVIAYDPYGNGLVSKEPIKKPKKPIKEKEDDTKKPDTKQKEIIEPEIIIIEKEKEEEKPNCVICMSEEAKIILCPCGHKCVCEACFNSINSRYPKRCPMCRKNFIGKIDHVFTP